MSDIEKTLDERGLRYGNDFLGQAQIAQGIKSAMRNSPNWDSMRVDQREALQMIATKISRILYGDPNYIDSWHDIIGYTRLIESGLEDQIGKSPPEEEPG